MFSQHNNAPRRKVALFCMLIALVAMFSSCSSSKSAPTTTLSALQQLQLEHDQHDAKVKAAIAECKSKLPPEARKLLESVLPAATATPTTQPGATTTTVDPLSAAKALQAQAEEQAKKIQSVIDQADKLRSEDVKSCLDTLHNLLGDTTTAATTTSSSSSTSTTSTTTSVATTVAAPVTTVKHRSGGSGGSGNGSGINTPITTAPHEAPTPSDASVVTYPSNTSVPAGEPAAPTTTVNVPPPPATTTTAPAPPAPPTTILACFPNPDPSCPKG